MSDVVTLYRAEAPEHRIIEPLDAMTLVYQRRSGITHMVSEPVPQILDMMAQDSLTAKDIAARLAAEFDLGSPDEAVAAITARLEELAELGLVDRIARA